MKVAVFGSGCFGTALATVAARSAAQVMIVTRSQAQVKSINETHRNNRVLTEYTIPDNVIATTSFEEALKDAEMIIHCIPAQQTEDYLKPLVPLIDPNVIFISTSKGIYVKTKQLLNQVLADVFQRPQPLAFLSGPSFAQGLMSGDPTAVVVASEDQAVAERIQKALSCDIFRIYTTDDVLGVEVGGALKNPIAIGAGIVEGLGLGINTMAALIVRGNNEIRRLAVAMGARSETLTGLSGIGDLMLTAFGGLSRNKAVGIRLAKGESLDDIVNSMVEVAEGVPTTAVACELAKQYNVHAPLLQALNDIMSAKRLPQDCQQHLMALSLRPEFE